MSKTILTAIDFSPCSRVAVAQAARLAKASNSTLAALYVIDTIAIVPLTGEMSAFQGQVTDSLLSEGRQMWADWSKQMPDLSNATFDIDIGSPVASIAHHAKKHAANLLVLGAHGVSSADKGPGIVAGSCVRRSPCDVLLVHDTQSEPFKNILACVDFSETSRLAVERAMSLAAIENATLHVVYAYTPPWERVALREGAPEGTDAFRTQYQQTLEKQIESFVTGSAGKAETTWAKPRYHAIPHKHHGKALAEFARTLNADLIVLGTRGSSNLHDILLGSTAEHVLRDARRSILAVRPKAS